MFAAGCEGWAMGWAMPGVVGETRVARFCSQISPPDGMPCSGNPQGNVTEPTDGLARRATFRVRLPRARQRVVTL